MKAKPATCKNIIPPSDMHAWIQTIPTGGGGGRIASRGRFVPKQKTTCDFPGEVRTPCPPPLCLRPYQSLKQFEFILLVRHYILPGLVIHKPSANYISGRERQRQHDSFKIKETAHFNSGYVLFKVWGRTWWP